MGRSYGGKRLAVIFNSRNSYVSAVNQLLTGLKSMPNRADQREYVTLQLHTLADQKAGQSMPASALMVTNASALSPVVSMFSDRFADFKTGWAADKQKTAHMALSDFRPSEAPRGAVATWNPKTFPSETIGMQGFGVAVNTNLYKALMARDVREGRLNDPGCDSSDASLVLAQCQPNVFSPDYTALMTGKTTSAAEFLRDVNETRVLNLNRVPFSNSQQTASQISFAGQANWDGKYPSLVGFAVLGSGGASWSVASYPIEVVVNPNFKVYTNYDERYLLAHVDADRVGLSIGVAALRLGNNPYAPWVKLDGQSPNFRSDKTLDSTQRLALQSGYPFAYEFQAIRSARLAPPYLDIYTAIVDGLKNPAFNLKGFAYINSSDASINTSWTRGGNNLSPLNRY